MLGLIASITIQSACSAVRLGGAGVGVGVGVGAGVGVGVMVGVDVVAGATQALKSKTTKNTDMSKFRFIVTSPSDSPSAATRPPHTQPDGCIVRCV